MGYYAEPPVRTGKAEWLIRNVGAEPISFPEAVELLGQPGEMVIVVLENGPFDAAGWAYSLDELDAFTDPDDSRPRTILRVQEGKVAPYCPWMEKPEAPKKPYIPPKLERFGTLRELTLIGLGDDGDGGIQGWGRILATIEGGRS